MIKTIISVPAKEAGFFVCVMKNPGMIVHQWKIEQEKIDEKLDLKYGYVKKRKVKYVRRLPT